MIPVQIGRTTVKYCVCLCMSDLDSFFVREKRGRLREGGTYERERDKTVMMGRLVLVVDRFSKNGLKRMHGLCRDRYVQNEPGR